LACIGAYLLYISWADRQVLGSPFKVTVLPPLVTDTVAVSSSATTQSRGGGGAGSVDLVDTSSRVIRETARETMTSRSAAATGAACLLEVSFRMSRFCFKMRSKCHKLRQKSCCKNYFSLAAI